LTWGSPSHHSGDRRGWFDAAIDPGEQVTITKRRVTDEELNHAARDLAAKLCALARQLPDGEAAWLRVPRPTALRPGPLRGRPPKRPLTRPDHSAGGPAAH
jgi:hypothetical protein